MLGKDDGQKLRTLDPVLLSVDIGDAELEGEFVGPGEEWFDTDLDLGDRCGVNVEGVQVTH